MKYKVGQKYRIMTLKEAEIKYPHQEWNEIFFDRHGGTVFTIERIYNDLVLEDEINVTLFGTDVDGFNIRLVTKYGEDKILVPLNYIKLEDDLFKL